VLVETGSALIITPRVGWAHCLVMRAVDRAAEAADALAKLLIEKGIITQAEFTEKLSQERAEYQRMLNPIVQ
jgi:hypothetical protein